MKKLRFYSTVCLFLMVIAACSNNSKPAAQKTATLKIGEGVQFSTGKITRQKSEGDMVFQYLPPQSPHGWRYNAITGQIEYQAQVGTNQNYPLLSAAKTGAFKTKPDLSKLTTGDINGWTEDEYDIGPGRYLLVRGYSDNKHWLVKILKLTAASNDPKTWTLSFTYEPANLSVGAAGTAGTNMPVQGVLSFRERLNSEKIININLSNGQVTELFDGYGVSRNTAGEFAYINMASQIVLADGNGKQLKVLLAPTSSTTESTIGGSGAMEAILSPNGSYIAVSGITRRQMHSESGINVQSIPHPSIAIIDRNGNELACFIGCTYPSWTRSGRLLMADLNNTGVFITDAPFKNRRQIPNIPSGHIDGIDLSPDEKTLALSVNQRIWLMNMDGSGLKQLTQSGLSEVTPSWSPDGKYLAFQQSIRNNKDFYEVIIYRLSDGKTLTVTDSNGANREPLGRFYWLLK